MGSSIQHMKWNGACPFQVVIAWSGKTLVLSFRGTNSLKNVKSDARVCASKLLAFADSQAKEPCRTHSRP